MYVKQPLLEEAAGVWIPLSAGDGGIDDTIGVMRRMVDKSLTDPALKALAVDLIRNVQPTDRLGYMKAIWEGVRRHMTYVPDTWKVEEVTSPAIHARRIMSSGKSWGDCDDFAALGAALLLSVGVPARLTVVASHKNGGKFDHVRTEAQAPTGAWVPLETTMKRVPFGQGVPTLRRKNYGV